MYLAAWMDVKMGCCEHLVGGVCVCVGFQHRKYILCKCGKVR